MYRPIQFSKYFAFFKKTKPMPSGCWEWLGARTQGGYGQMGARFITKHRTATAHRVAYWLFIGWVPADMEVHHTCHNPWCVNPDHLELVTPEQNKYMKHGKKQSDVCPQGHPYDSVDSQGCRRCSVCRKAAQGRYTAKKKAA